MKSKRKLAKVQKSKDFFAAEREKILKKVGYLDLKAKHGDSKRPDFPDYHIDNPYTLSNNIDSNGLRRQRGSDHKDANVYPVGHDHKSGIRLIIQTDDLAYLGGKKT